MAARMKKTAALADVQGQRHMSPELDRYLAARKTAWESVQSREAGPPFAK